MTDVTISLPGDSLEYEILKDGTKLALESTEEGMTCELGLRLGGGTRFILEALYDASLEGDKGRTHIAIDPYGNIEYPDRDDLVRRYDYNNDMRDQCLPNVYMYARYLKIDFQFFCMEDTEFFYRFSDGVPLYGNDFKHMGTKYCLVHFDGPHQTDLILDEMEFFLPRTPVGGVWVFDDLDNYDHDQVENACFDFGFETVQRSHRKASYQKVK